MFSRYLSQYALVSLWTSFFILVYAFVVIVFVLLKSVRRRIVRFSFMPNGVSPIRFVLVLRCLYFVLCIFLVFFCCCFFLELLRWDGPVVFRIASILWCSSVNKRAACGGKLASTNWFLSKLLTVFVEDDVGDGDSTRAIFRASFGFAVNGYSLYG